MMTLADGAFARTIRDAEIVQVKSREAQYHASVFVGTSFEALRNDLETIRMPVIQAESFAVAFSFVCSAAPEHALLDTVNTRQDVLGCLWTSGDSQRHTCQRMSAETVNGTQRCSCSPQNDSTDNTQSYV